LFPHRLRIRILAAFLVLGFAFVPAYAFLAGMSGEQKREALKDPKLVGWFYEDLPGAIAEAKKTGKPLMVVFR